MQETAGAHWRHQHARWQGDLRGCRGSARTEIQGAVLVARSAIPARANACESSTSARPETQRASIQQCPEKGNQSKTYEKISLHFSQCRALRSLRAKDLNRQSARG